MDYLRPDGKTQVTVEYDQEDRPLRIDAVVVSTQHGPEASLDQIRQDMIQLVITPIIPAELLDDPAAYDRMAKAVNPYGDGRACPRIAQAILSHFLGAQPPEPFVPAH